MTKSAARETLRRRLGALDAELAEALGRDERVVGDDAHAQPARAARDLLADAAEAEDAERLARELDAAVRAPLPAALLERRVGLRDVARSATSRPIVCSAAETTVDSGAFATTMPAPRRRRDVDVVDADSRAADHLQAARRGRSARR